MFDYNKDFIFDYRICFYCIVEMRRKEMYACLLMITSHFRIIKNVLISLIANVDTNLKQKLVTL